MSWQEERRRDREARAEQARRDAVAAAEVETLRVRAQADARRADVELAAQLRVTAEREQRAADEAAEARRRARRGRGWARSREWAAGHVVDLLVYPLALVSAAMAVPAMAVFGHEVYGHAAGYALPVITELGMWAFALAVQYTRRRHPDRPVWALQLGVWLFAAVAFGLNALHGLARSWVAGSVMGVASVAGVAAHQLVTAAPRRSRSERDAMRMTRRAGRKVARARRAAVGAAVAEIDADGAARLVFAPGRFALRGGRLAPATVPGLPVPADPDGEWDRALVELLADPGRIERGAATDTTTGSTPPAAGGSVGTLDRDPDRPVDQHESTPGRDPDRGARRRGSRQDSRQGSRRAGRAAGGRQARPRTRSIEELRTELRAVIEADPASIDVTSAESIRRALRCSPTRARQLRDDHTTDPTTEQ